MKASLLLPPAASCAFGAGEPRWAQSLSPCGIARDQGSGAYRDRTGDLRLAKPAIADLLLVKPAINSTRTCDVPCPFEVGELNAEDALEPCRLRFSLGALPVSINVARYFQRRVAQMP